MTKRQRTSKPRALSASDLDSMHDAGSDLSAHVDLGKAIRPGRAVQRVNVDFQAFINVRLADSLFKNR